MKVKSTPDDYLDVAKNMSKDEMVLVVALWLMICRNRYAEENMSSEEFNISVDSCILETYLFSREVSILDSIKSSLKSKWEDD